MNLPEGSLISYMSNKVKLRGGINLAQGIPGVNPPEQLLKIISEFARNPVAKYHQYAPGTGCLELKEEVCRLYNKDLSSENLLIVNGATEAISLLYLYLSRKLEKKLDVCSFSPFYESYNNLPENLGGNFSSISFENRQDSSLTANQSFLEDFFRENNCDLFFLASPGNPYGRIYNEEEIKLLISLSEKYKFYLIFDMVYKELYFAKKPYDPLSAKGSSFLKENIFYVNSFSKMLSVSGWRIGYLFTHRCHLPAIMKIHDYTGLCAPSLFQLSLAEYLKNDDWKKYTENLRKKLYNNYKSALLRLKESGFSIPDCGGGYFIWAKLPDYIKDDCFLFAEKLYEKYQVAIVPGVHFDRVADRFIRINILQNEEILTPGINFVLEAVKNYEKNC